MAKFYISSGHSANDPGAVGYVVERDYVWEISNMIADEIKSLGHAAYRDKWDYTWKQTVEEANRLGVDFFFEIHANAGNGDGAEVIIYNSNNQYISDMFRRAFEEVGQNWRRTIYDSTFWVLKYTIMPAAIVELAFVDNKKDIKDFDDTSEKLRLAKSLAKHIVSLKGGPINKPTAGTSKPKPQTERTISDVYNPKTPLTVKQAVKAGQAISNIILGTNIAEDGIDGPDTQKNKVKILQWAMNKDYLLKLKIDGKADINTKEALGNHTVREGETQYMVTAAEVLLLMNGYNPHGVEIPGQFGSGLGQCVMAYQMDHSNLTNDRIVGRKTYLQLIV